MTDDDDGFIVPGPLCADDGRILADLRFQDVVRLVRSEGWIVVIYNEYFSIFLRDLGILEMIHSVLAVCQGYS